MKRILFALSAAALLTLSACGSGAGGSGGSPGKGTTPGISQNTDTDDRNGQDNSEGPNGPVTTGQGSNNGKNDKDGGNSMDNAQFKALFEGLKLSQAYKGYKEANPIMVQTYGADPCAMVYKDRVYIYMTADTYEYDADGNIKDNGYGLIKSIRVVSTDDFVNYTDHGSINVAGPNGACKWAHNSWAPTAAWKNIDGVDRFFLYFADSGNGIGVLTSDSPAGPFTDEIGHALVNRSVENCANITWLFDPAVLVDDDGTGYLYFGGGVPQGQAPHPQTARCVRLGKDMMSLDCTPITIDPPYLFEDSGIHKYNGKYYYSYCTNWNVDEAGTAEYGFANGEIAVMVSDSPLGPFTYQERVLRNPGTVCGLYGNNHHSIFAFKDKW
ncbi:MAG: family 43 glycosylhydrolase, partial [Lachnospiraceae bacterium]|nr:family 43 glycosylhydrolase [Lachnospiraceae bacterium]